MSEVNHEEAARKQGWVPQDEWKGDSEKWTDAETFVERGEKIAGIATKRAKDLESEVEELKATVGKLQTSNAEFGEFHRQSIAKAEDERDAAINQLQQRRAEAITNGEGEEAVRLEREIADAQKAPSKQQEWAKTWAGNNAWYGNDPVLRAVADAKAEQLRQSGSTLGEGQFLEEVTRLTKEEMPHKFTNPNRSTAVTAGESEGDEITTPNGSFDSLPADVKAQCDQWIAEGLIKDRKSYMKDYNG